MPKYIVTYTKEVEADDADAAQAQALFEIEGPQYPAGFQVTEVPPPPPEIRCSKCECLESDADWGSLFPIEVITNAGEEGHADVIQLLCNDCFTEVVHGLIELGFKDHRHGGANFLEDIDCCENPYENCPTPSGYGEYYVGNPHLNPDYDD